MRMRWHQWLDQYVMMKHVAMLVMALGHYVTAIDDVSSHMKRWLQGL